MNYKKYKPYPKMNMANRKWPDNIITKAPIWCSVDLRDGNQALEVPMTLDQKIEFFNFLVKIGFKQIEIGFPAASETEFKFTRELIEKNLIPDDVIVQVLTQSREHIIKRTFEALDGVKKAVVHLYNSTSKLQREVVFEKGESEIIDLAVYGANTMKELAKKYGEERFIFEYSPESFTGTEPEFAVSICNAVLDVLKPASQNKVIINLPATVEMSTPNIFADQIEYMCSKLKYRDNIIVSVHAHNDRGTAVAATELGIMAGADRVEGTLFGNGERTGNADILTLSMNLYSQGIDPLIDLSKIDQVVEIYERSTGLSVHERHPYAGELVYTAFSGSHQDAISKGLAKLKGDIWEVPYLPIDPIDVGRTYDPIIRINSQSGKGGIAFILQQGFGLQVPKRMLADFSIAVKNASDQNNQELTSENVSLLFKNEYINLNNYISLIKYDESANGETRISAEIAVESKLRQIAGVGNGLISAFCNALKESLSIEFEVVNYSEHSLDYAYGTKSRAITYIEIVDQNKVSYFGAGISRNISKSSIRAVVSAVNRMIKSSN